MTNTLIIDRTEQNFKRHKDIGLVLPWRAKKRDIKLLQLLDLLQPVFDEEVINSHIQNYPFCQHIAAIRVKLAGTIKRRLPLQRQPKMVTCYDEEHPYPKRLSHGK
jgi:hypothetical protein